MSKALFLKADQYVRYEVGDAGGAEGADDGYPKALTAGWTGLTGPDVDFGSDIDTALATASGHVCFFKGSHFLRIDQQHNAVDDVPKSIADEWHGMGDAGFGDGLDAAIRSDDDTVFFFKGDSYVQYKLGADQLSGGPMLIAADWNGLADTGFADGIEAAVKWNDETVFFFKGADYVAYDVANNKIYDGYPLVIADRWPGLAERNFADGLNAVWVRLGAATVPEPVPHPVGQLEAGDHIWYWNGKTSTETDIPRLTWFPDASKTDKTDYGGHGREIYQFVIHADHIKRGQPHMLGGPGTFSWINNNPGNLTAGGTSVGEYPGKRNWHDFLIFPSHEAGFGAIPKFLQANHYGPLSISAAFERYAPEKDGNNPKHYAQTVVDALGGAVTLDTKIDDLTPEQMLQVQGAIEQMEGSVPGATFTLDDAQLPDAVRALL